MGEWRPTVVPYPVYPYWPRYWYYPYPDWPWYPYYLPPVYLPAETLYGPEAVKRFMGVDRLVPSPSATTRPSKTTIERKARDERPAAARVSNKDALVRAGKFLGYGDNHFSAQRYNDAYQRYKKAAESAPDLAEAYFRQGYALIAMGRYELAAKAIKRGLELDRGWARSAFRNAELYGPDSQAAKKAHLDALAKAATDAPEAPDLLFLLGVLLYFDGQAERAAPFFQRADQLGGGSHLKGFLEQIEKLGQQKQELDQKAKERKQEGLFKE